MAPENLLKTNQPGKHLESRQQECFRLTLAFSHLRLIFKLLEMQSQ